jgi:hypothetical protein
MTVRSGGGVRGGLRALGAEVGQAVLDVVGDAVGEDRTQGRDAHRTTEGAEEGHDGRGGAEVLGGHLVLCGEHQVLHHHADAQAHQGHEDRDVPVLGVVADGAQ